MKERKGTLSGDFNFSYFCYFMKEIQNRGGGTWIKKESIVVEWKHKYEEWKYNLLGCYTQLLQINYSRAKTTIK